MIYTEQDTVSLYSRDKEVVSFLMENDGEKLPPLLNRQSYISRLKKAGIIENDALVGGYYRISDFGKNLFRRGWLQQARAAAQPTAYISHTPTGKNAKKIRKMVDSALCSKLTGSFMGGEITQADKDFLCGKRRAKTSTVIWFLYNAGVPLKHIAWAVREFAPLATDHSISTARISLGIKRRSTKGQMVSDETCRLVLDLLNEGCSEDEVKKFYGLPKSKIRKIQASQKRR